MPEGHQQSPDGIPARQQASTGPMSRYQGVRVPPPPESIIITEINQTKFSWIEIQF